MAKGGFKIMDSDMHVFEPPDLWQRYTAPEFRDSAPRCMTDEPRDFAMKFLGEIIPVPSLHEDEVSIAARRQTEENQSRQYAHAIERMWDSESQVQAMDSEGIDVAAMYPSRGLMPLAIDGIDPALGAAVAAAYNDWLHEFCQRDPDRMFGVAMVSLHDVPSAVEEARRTVRDYGFRGVFLRPNFINGRPWHDSYYDPFWAAIEELGIGVGFHEGGAIPAAQVGKELESEALHHIVSHPLEMMLAGVSLIGGGVFERFPGLRVAFLEANCSWVPWMLWRMDDVLEPTTWAGLQHLDLKRKPSEYFERHCYVSIEPDEEPAKNVLSMIGQQNIVFSTDYPHLDSKFPKAVDYFLDQPIESDEKRRFLWDNCAHFYGFS